MSLTLRVENVSSLTSGDPIEMSLAEHGLVIGRAAHADWTLPDPANHVSSIHCEVDYSDGRYVMTDRSTNGTFVNGSPRRPTEPVELRDGDLLTIGPYQVRVIATGGANTGTAHGGGSNAANPFGGIDWHGAGGEAAAPVSQDRFGREAPRALFQSASDPLMAAFAAPRPAAGDAIGEIATPDPFGLAPASAPPPASPNPFGMGAMPVADPFARAPTPPSPDPFGMTPSPSAADPFNVTPPAHAAHPSAADPFGATPSAGVANPFGATSATSVTNPFGTAAVPPPALDPLGGVDRPTSASTAPRTPAAPASGMPVNDPWAALGGGIDFGLPPPSAPPPVAPAIPVADAAPSPAPASMPTAGSPDILYERLLGAMGLEQRDMGGRSPEQVVDAVGGLLRRATSGLFRLLEARSRVRHQFGVGAQVTTFQSDGNNPLKWTRSPEEALKQMAGAPARGFLEGDKAVQGAFEDLQAHEMAMIAAMQEALAETIRRFAPDTIRQRISAKGWLKSVLPGAKEATLWRAYESEFGAFADESEAAYLDLFARQFKKAYERIVMASGQAPRD